MLTFLKFFKTTKPIWQENGNGTKVVCADPRKWKLGVCKAHRGESTHWETCLETPSPATAFWVFQALPPRLARLCHRAQWGPWAVPPLAPGLYRTSLEVDALLFYFSGDLKYPHVVFLNVSFFAHLGSSHGHLFSHSVPKENPYEVH